MKRSPILVFVFLASTFLIHGQNLNIEFKINNQKWMNDSICKVELEVTTHHSDFIYPEEAEINRFNKNNIKRPETTTANDSLFLSTLKYKSKTFVHFSYNGKRRLVKHAILVLYFHRNYLLDGLHIVAGPVSRYLKTN